MTEFPFSRLPGELRNQIYGFLVASRDLAILRTNRVISNEVIPLIDKEIPYLMFVNYPKGLECRSNLPTRGTGERIQNVDVCWSVPDHDDEFDRDDEGILAFRWDPNIPRGVCSVHLEIHPFHHTFMEPDDFEAMKTLQSFEEVVMHIVPKFLEGAPVLECFDETLEKAVDMVSAFRQELELALGVAVEGLDNKGRYLAFRPINNSTICSDNIPVSDTEYTF
ncbi:hypothetical protein OEA41_009056 [Lepraria neglecta]|uniref:F-box domain-containing protein n=1 Tax=Lepraria neglecta TaxID=209136 RepID=A0AAD9Z468_9LECA|nr:hypothetical protein OEA41_009056 [Lepraria neglecta]